MKVEVELKTVKATEVINRGATVHEEYCKGLCDKFGDDIIIRIRKPPNYISNLKINNQDDDVILVYKEGKINDNAILSKIHLSEITGIEGSIADLSVTGQPLECPFRNEDETLNISVPIEPVVVTEEHFHAPLSMVDARKCLTIINLKLPPPLPVWILTDMSERNKVFLMGSEIESNWRTRFWAIFHSNQICKFPIKDMLDDFEHTFKVKSGFKISSEVSCMFSLKDEPGMAKHSKFFIEAKWKRPSYEVPISEADTSLKIECNVGKDESQISRWWQQLILLHEYLEIIKQRKQVRDVQISYERNSIKLPSFKASEGQASDQPLTSRVMELLQLSDSMSVCRQLNTIQNTTSALNSTIHTLLADSQQKGQDFTDRLWSLLIEASTYQELTECFQLVLREVRKQQVKPYIFAKNTTRMGSLLRNPRISSSEVELMFEPLELMVEIGLEKLKGDYMFMFLASQIATVVPLALPKLPSFCEVKSSEWQTTVETWLQWLAQLHTVLELLSVIHTSMDFAVVVQVTSLALSTYVHTGPTALIPSLMHLINNRTYQLCAPVPTNEVKVLIEGDKSFYKWMLKISATADKHKVSSTYVLLQDSILPHNLLMLMMDHDSLNDTDIISESLQESLSCENELKLQSEKYCYVQFNSVSENLPPFKILK